MTLLEKSVPLAILITCQSVFAVGGSNFNSKISSNSSDLEGLDDFSIQTSVNLEDKSGKILTTNWFKHPKDAFNALSKEDKLIATNVAGIAFVSLVGFASWDYGSSAKLYKRDEGWFGNDTKYGGADKLGHAWSTYAFADVLASYYEEWGYDHGKATLYGAISSWIVMGLMEVGDGSSSDHGFSKEDMIMNSVGAAMSLFLGQFPEVDNVVDFRIMYTLNSTPGDLMTDYENMTYIAAFKLDGVKFIQNKYLKMIEFQVGYNTRGYDVKKEDGSTERNLYVGLNFDFSKFFREKGHKKTSRYLEYLQIPYSSHGVGVNFDSEDKDVEAITHGFSYTEKK
jgi:hypothetical protein